MNETYWNISDINEPRESMNLSADQDYKGGDEIYQKQLAVAPIWYHYLVMITLSTLGMVGVFLNGYVIGCFAFCSIIRTPYNLILINLAAVEFLLCAVGVSTDIFAIMNKGWVLGKTICYTTGTITTTSGFVSMFTLCSLSLCRLGNFFRVGPLNGKVSSFQTAAKILVVVWLCALSLSLPPLIGWGRYVPEMSGLGCAPDWHSKQRHVSYIIWILAFGFVIPTIIIVISTVITFINMHKLRKSIRSPEVRRRSVKRDHKALTLVFSMNIAYLVCWSPYGVLAILHVLVSKSIIGPMLSMVPTLTVKLSVCINPILYIALNSQFRGTFMRYIPCRKRSQFRTQRKSFIFKLKVIPNKNPNPDDDATEDHRTSRRNSRSQSFGTQTPREWESNGVTNAISNSEVDRNIQMINQHISISGDNCCIVSSSNWNKPKNDVWLENVLSNFRETSV